MTDIEIIEGYRNFYPELINDNNEIKMYQNNKMEFIKYTSQMRERAFYSLTTGRHLQHQEYVGMKTEEHLDISFLSSFKGIKKSIDICFFDLKDCVSGIVENAILENNSPQKLEEKIKEKLTQAINYSLVIADTNSKYKLSENKIFIQVNIYNPSLILKNSKQYETYCSSNPKLYSEEKIFSHTGIFQRLWVFNQEDLYKIKKNFSNGISVSELDRNPLLKEYFNNFCSSSNFILMNFDNSIKIDLEDKVLFNIKFKRTINNNLALKKMPFRSVQRGGSSFDNTRQIDFERSGFLKEDIAKNFIELLEDNKFINDDSLIANELQRPGWNDRKLYASYEETIVQTKNNNEIFIMSSDMALANEQHNSYALLLLKQDIKELLKKSITEQREYFKMIGYAHYSALQQHEMDTFFNLIMVVNPMLQFELFINKKNGKRSAKISNSIASQSVLDKASFIEKENLQTLSQAMNVEDNHNHFYSGTDISQDPKNRLTNEFNVFDITNLCMINSSFKRGQEIAKLRKNNNDIKKVIINLNSDKSVLNLNTEDAFEFIVKRKLFNWADKKTENLSGIKDLYNENTVDDNKGTKAKKDKLLAFLSENKEEFSSTNAKDCLKLINEFSGSVSKELRFSLNTIENFFNGHLQFNSEQIITEGAIEKLFLSFKDIGVQVNTKKLFEMVKIYNYGIQQNTSEYKELFTSKEIMIRLVSTILGYLNEKHNYQLSYDNFVKLYEKIIQNIKNSDRTNWRPTELRNKNFIDLEYIHIDILNSLFKDLIPLNKEA